MYRNGGVGILTKSITLGQRQKTQDGNFLTKLFCFMEIKTPEVVPSAEATPVAPVAPEAPAPAVAPTEKTVSEVMAPASNDTVPLAAHLETKNENKELKKSLKALEAKIAEGGNADDVTDDLAAIGEEFGVDPKFMKKLGAAVSAKVAAAKAEVGQELAGLKEKDRSAELDRVFGTHFDSAIEAMPEFKDIANREVIKTLSLDPKNANKTFSQIIEETYGHAISGKRSIETTTPGGGKGPEPIDYARASRDNAYFSEIMKDPAKKAEYNKDLAKRLRL